MANIKNFGLNGVGSTVQYGKAGGHVQFSGGKFIITDADGTTAVKLQGADGVLASDYVTKQQLDQAVVGLEPLASVAVASTANIAALSGLVTIDGHTLIAGDRILVKDQTTKTQNGIYVAAAGAWARSSDFAASATIAYGTYVFVVNGTTQNSTSWNVYQGPTNSGQTEVVVGTSDIYWTLFARSIQYSATQGVQLNGNTFSLDIGSAPLGSGATLPTSASTIAYADGIGSTNHSLSFGSIFGNFQVPNNIGTSAGLVTSSGAGVYSTATLTAPSNGGLKVAVVGGNYQFSVDTTNMALLDATGVSGATNVLIDNGDGVAKHVSADDFRTALVVPTLAGVSNGITVKTGTDTLVGRSIVAAGAGATAGIVVTNGDGVAANPTVGLDINNLTATTTASGSDALVLSTAGGNKKITVDNLVNYIDLTANEITQGDSSVIVSDTGTNGTVTISADATPVLTATIAGVSVTALKDTSLTSGQVVYATSGGALTTSSGLAYDGSNLTVGNDINVGNDLGVTGTSNFTGQVTANQVAATDITASTIVLSNSAETQYLTVHEVATADISKANVFVAGEISGGYSGPRPGVIQVVGSSVADGGTISTSSASLDITGTSGINLTTNNNPLAVYNGALKVLNVDAATGAVDTLSIISDAGSGVELATTGGNIQFTLAGTADTLRISTPSTAAVYSSAMVNDQDIPNKYYVDHAISSGAAQGSIKAYKATVSLAANGSFNVGSALPAGATVLSIKVNITSASGAATVLTVGTAAVASRYAAASDIDASSLGLYVIETYDTDAGVVQVKATVSSTTGAGTAQVLVEYQVAE